MLTAKRLSKAILWKRHNCSDLRWGVLFLGLSSDSRGSGILEAVSECGYEVAKSEKRVGRGERADSQKWLSHGWAIRR